MTTYRCDGGPHQRACDWTGPASYSPDPDADPDVPWCPRCGGKAVAIVDRPSAITAAKDRLQAMLDRPAPPLLDGPAVDPREAEVQALWLVQPVRCVGNDEPPCGWVGVGADIAEWEQSGEIPLCPKCDGGVVENIVEVGGCSCGAKFYSYEAIDNHECSLPEARHDDPPFAWAAVYDDGTLPHVFVGEDAEAKAREREATVFRILAAPLDAAVFDRVRLVAIGCADADRIAGRPWECRCPYCRMAIRELVRRAIEREEEAEVQRVMEAAGPMLERVERRARRVPGVSGPVHGFVYNGKWRPWGAKL